MVHRLGHGEGNPGKLSPALSPALVGQSGLNRAGYGRALLCVGRAQWPAGSVLSARSGANERLARRRGHPVRSPFAGPQRPRKGNANPTRSPVRERSCVQGRVEGTTYRMRHTLAREALKRATRVPQRVMRCGAAGRTVSTIRGPAGRALVVATGTHKLVRRCHSNHDSSTGRTPCMIIRTMHHNYAMVGVMQHIKRMLRGAGGALPSTCPEWLRYGGCFGEHCNWNYRCNLSLATALALEA